MDLTADDWARTPWTYPGSPAPHGGLLHEGEYLPLAPGPGPLGAARLSGGTADEGSDRSLDELLAAAALAPCAERRLVVAVGSNASPAVMARKLGAAGVSMTVPFLAVVVTGLTVGHSAHVSRAGFFAAAPFLADGAATRTFGSILDDEQMSALDRTEPNYERRTLGSQRCPIEVDGGQRPGAFMVYDSRWGVVGIPGRPPWPLSPQEELFSRLVRHCAAFAEWVGPSSGPREVMSALAADGDLRTRVREMLQADGWARPSGLATGQSAG